MLPRGRWWLLALLLAVASPFVGSGCVKKWLFHRLPSPSAEPSAMPPGLPDLSARTCGACHLDIYAEWASSMMGRAATDPVFRADWAKTGHFYACRACHAPLLEQQPELVTSLATLRPLRGAGTPNPAYDPKLEAEGVTCVVCHLRDEALVGPMPDPVAPHPVTVDPAFADAARCEACHQLGHPPLSDLDRPVSDTHGEWEAWKATTGRRETCAACHMPAVTRPVATGGPVRAGRAHTFGGAWDDAMLRAGLDVELRPDASVLLTNLAGHGYPTGDPARALEVTVTLLRDGAVTRASTWWIERRVRLPRLVDLRDTTLRPAETRVLRVDPGDATSARLSVVFHRLRGLPDTAPHATAPVQVTLVEQEIALSAESM